MRTTSSKTLWAGVCAVAGGLLFGAAPAARADIRFEDDFESGLSNGNWLTPSSAVVVSDPLLPSSSGNEVLKFGARATGGDLFSKTFTINAGQEYFLAFSYYQTSAAEDDHPTTDTDANWDAGGAIGYYDFLSGGVRTAHFLAVAQANYVGEIFTQYLEHDGVTWQDYVIAFSVGSGGDPIQVGLVLEDFAGSGPGGDGSNTAFFDNIKVTDVDPRTVVPEPATLSLLAVGTLSLLGRRRRARG